MPGAAGLEVLWASRLSEAVEGAKRLRDGRILIFFVEPDCGQCKRMEALVVPSTSFYSYTRDKVPLYEDVSTDEGQGPRAAPPDPRHADVDRRHAGPSRMRPPGRVRRRSRAG